MTGGCERRREGRERRREGIKGKEKERRKEKRKKEKMKGRKERRKGKKRREAGLMAGHGRWSPVAAGGGRRRPKSGGPSPSPSNNGVASLAHLENLEFCKRDFGERSNSSLERALRGEEDGVVRGGQGGVGGGENGGEVLEVNGLFSCCLLYTSPSPRDS